MRTSTQGREVHTKLEVVPVISLLLLTICLPCQLRKISVVIGYKNSSKRVRNEFRSKFGKVCLPEQNNMYITEHIFSIFFRFPQHPLHSKHSFSAAVERQRGHVLEPPGESVVENKQLLQSYKVFQQKETDAFY